MIVSKFLDSDIPYITEYFLDLQIQQTPYPFAQVPYAVPPKLEHSLAV